jgi:Protein of unknown function (DUF3221)
MLISKTQTQGDVGPSTILLEGNILIQDNRIFLVQKDGQANAYLVFNDEQTGHDLQTGDRVNVWSWGILESNPAQIIVDTYENIE